jgi:pilus assembly protein CpaE
VTSASQIDLYVLDRDERVGPALRPVLAEAGLRLAGTATSAEQVLPTLMSTCPDVVLMDVSACTDVALTVRKIVMSCPRSCVIVTGAGTPPSTMSRAVSAGARGFLIKPYSPSDVIGTITEALDVARAVGQVQPARTAPARGRGRLVAVYSPKGGVGSTTVAANLAVALASRPKTSVALVDLDLQFGDVGTVLDLKGANSLAEVVGHEDLTDELIQETFVAHPSGVRVLLAPDNLQLVETIDPEQVTRLLTQLRPHFDYVIADLWSSFEALTLGVLRTADRILLVTTPELPSLRDVQRLLRSLQSDPQLDEKLMIVANRYPARTGLSKDDMTKALGRKIAATIPSEGISVTDAINRGLSLLDARARVRLARQYHDLAALVAASDGVEKTAVAQDRLNEVPR